MYILQMALEVIVMLMMVVVLLAALIGGIVSGILLYRDYNEIVTYPWEKAEKRAAKKAEREKERARREFWKS